MAAVRPRWPRGRGGGRRPLLGGGHRPFGGPVVEAIAGWADNRIDISHPSVWVEAPEAARAVLAHKFGWEAVRGPGPLTWHEAVLSLQVLAEERIGTAQRQQVLEAKQAEDAAANAAAQATRDR